MYSFEELQDVAASPAELVFWASIVDGPEPLAVEERGGWPVVTQWEPQVPTIHLNKDGCYMATLAYRGADVTMLEKEERLVYLHRLHGVLKRLGTGWGLLAEEWHEPSSDYPQSAWRHPVAAFLDASRRALMQSGAVYESHFFLTLTWKPEDTRQQQWYDTLFTSERTVQRSDREHRASFRRAILQWADLLSGVLPEVRWLTPDEDVTHLANTVRWERYPIRLPEIPFGLDSQLTSGDFLPGHTCQLGHVLPESDPPRLEKYLRCLAVKTWPDAVGFTIPAALQQGCAFPYKYTVRWLALDKQDGEGVLKDYQEGWTQLIWEGWQIVGKLFPSDAQANADSIDLPLIDLRDERTATGFLTPVVTVWGDTLEELAARERTVLKILQGQGLLCMPEMVNAAQAWQGTLPGDMVHGNRETPQSSLLLAFLLPHGAIYAGPQRDAHLDDVPLFTTSSDGAPFRYVMHPHGPVGSYHLTGPTRRGKTAMFMFMALQFLRYRGAQVFCIDTDWQMYVTTLLAGGSHYDLGRSGGLGFHLLGRLDASEDERRWAEGWLEDVCEAQGLPATAEEQTQIWQALGRVAQLPPHLRTLTNFRECLAARRLWPALKPFLQGEAYPYFDASSDSFALDWWTTLEMKTILAQPRALPHAMQYIFHRIDAKLDGRPTLIEMDEVATIFEHPIMVRRAKQALKTEAKKNVALGLAWQEIVDASDSPIWQAIQASCDTEWYLPNDKALNTDVMPHYTKMGLQPGQIAGLAVAQPFQDYLYKTKNATRMVQMRLSPLERALCAASSPEDIAAMRTLHAAWQAGQFTESLCAAWLRQCGFPVEADIYEREYAQKGDACPQT